MARTIVISNQKGGVGKTTTAVNLCASLGAAEKRTLLIDLDPQGNATSGCGIDDYDTTSYEVMLGNAPIKGAVLPTTIPYPRHHPRRPAPRGSRDRTGVSDVPGAVPQEGARGVGERYDFIVIDTPPSLGLLTLNALTAADSILIPIQCEYYALEGLSQLLSTIQLVQKSLNPTLRIEGVLLTMFDRRLKLSNQVAEEAIEYFGDTVYQTKIPAMFG